MTISLTQGGRIKPRTQTCHSAWPAWPPPAGSPVRAQRWRGCSGACCPCPSSSGAGYAGMLCLGQWVPAPGPGCTAGAAWRGCPVGSEGEEKPLHTRARAPGSKVGQSIRNTATCHCPPKQWLTIRSLK